MKRWHLKWWSWWSRCWCYTRQSSTLFATVASDCSRPSSCCWSAALNITWSSTYSIYTRNRRLSERLDSQRIFPTTVQYKQGCFHHITQESQYYSICFPFRLLHHLTIHYESRSGTSTAFDIIILVLRVHTHPHIEPDLPQLPYDCHVFWCQRAQSRCFTIWHDLSKVLIRCLATGSQTCLVFQKIE